ncbi:MAG: DCC1-like thiol-disulfide oxidoreductase family protein [Bacteroidota bacterium]
MKERTDKTGDPGGASVILYDGVCALCNWAVRFIVERDPEGQFLFAPLQSDVGQKLLIDRRLPVDALDTVILVEAEEVFGRSEAAFRVLGRLRTAWRVLLFFQYVPRVVTDGAYRLIARSRYRVFGRYDACPMPTPEQRKRFLDGAFPSSTEL